jgi:hypothetical protein
MYKNGTKGLSRFVSRTIAAAALFSAAGALAAPSGPPLASSFPGPLWQVVAPKGGTAWIADAHLVLNVPGGSNHSVLPANRTVRVVQPIGDQDFDVSIKIDSPIHARDEGTSQGLMVLAGDQDFLTFGLVTDGTNISLSALKVSGGVADTVFTMASFNEYQNPICLRLSRNRSSYAAYYSVDGVVWTLATSFNDTRVPTSVGPFAGNYNRNPARAVPVVMAINWFNVL